MPQSELIPGRRGVLRSLATRLLTMTRILPGVGRARPESFGVEDGPGERTPITDEAGQTLHEQDDPGAPRHEPDHPTR